MERDDIEGAKAAAEYFLALYQYIFATGDVREWRAMSHDDCQFCRGAEERVTQLFGNGGYSVGGEFTVDEVVALPPGSSPDNAYRVGLSGTEGASTEYAANGEEAQTLNGGRARYSFALVRENQHWSVLGGSVEALEER